MMIDFRSKSIEPRSSIMFEVKGSKKPLGIQVRRKRYFLEMELGSNHKPRTSEEDALSTTPPDLGFVNVLEGCALDTCISFPPQSTVPGPKRQTTDLNVKTG